MYNVRIFAVLYATAFGRLVAATLLFAPIQGSWEDSIRISSAFPCKIGQS